MTRKWVRKWPTEEVRLLFDFNLLEVPGSLKLVTTGQSVNGRQWATDIFVDGDIAYTRGLIQVANTLLQHAMIVSANLRLVRWPTWSSIIFRSKTYLSSSKGHRFPSPLIDHSPDPSDALPWQYDFDPNDKHLILPDLSNETLIRLVKGERYAAADRIRVRLIDTGIPIQPHFIYEKAALAGLRWPNLDTRLRAFSTWFSLVPNGQHTSGPPQEEQDPFRETRNALFRSGFPSANLPLIIKFALICASKGYAHVIWREVILVLISFVTPAIGAKYLRDFEDAAMQHGIKYYPEKVNKMAMRQRNLSVTISCHAEWLDEAVRMLQSTPRNFPILDSTYGLLIQKLQERKDYKNIRSVEVLRLRHHELSCRHLPKRESTLHLSPTTMSFDSPISPKYHDTLPPPIAVHSPSPSLSSTTRPKPALSARITSSPSPFPDIRIALAIHLKRLKHTLTLRNSSFLNVTTLLRFMTSYSAASSNPSCFLSILRKKAVCTADGTAYVWLTAQMTYYDEQKEYSRVLAIFAAHFDGSGLSKNILHTITQASDYVASEGSETTTFPTKLKLSPNDSWLVWNALTRLSIPSIPPNNISTSPALQSLYASFLAYIAPLSQNSRSQFPVVFRSFIWAFAQHRRLDKAAEVLPDMRKMGRKPDRRHYDMLAGAYASVGDVEGAMGVLEVIEGDAVRVERECGFGAVRMRKNMWNGVTMQPKFSTYGLVIRGFVEAGRLGAARDVENRMKVKLEYIPGVNVEMDKTLSLLRRAEECTQSSDVC